MQTQTQTRTKVYTVTQVNSLVKDVLQANLPSWLSIKGEITDWKQHQSGHCYFCLKDEESVLPCAMWRGSFSKVKFKPGNGLAVLVSGSIDLYVPQGRYKLIVEEMIPAGMGALQLAFEQMVRKLEAEGLFSAGPQEAASQVPPADRNSHERVRGRGPRHRRQHLQPLALHAAGFVSRAGPGAGSGRGDCRRHPRHQPAQRPAQARRPDRRSRRRVAGGPLGFQRGKSWPGPFSSRESRSSAPSGTRSM